MVSVSVVSPRLPRIFLLTLCLLLCLATIASADEPARDKTSRVRETLNSVRFVAYTPTDFAVWNGQIKAASAKRIEQDLTRLRPDFQGLITYSCGNGGELVPDIAQRLGFRAVILGIWEPTSAKEIAAAVAVARRFPKLVIGIAVGNENLLAHRLPWPVLRGAMEQVRAALPGVAVTTSEPFHYYLSDELPDFLAAQDFLLPNVHPTSQPWFADSSLATQVDFVIQVVTKLATRTNKPILVKETGLPSGPKALGFTPERQARFWRLLNARLAADTTRTIAFFEAYDQPWKAENARQEFGLHPEEGYWGFYDSQGRAKPVLQELREQWRPPLQK